MVPLPRAGADRFLKGEVLLAVPQVKIAYRGIGIRPVEDGACGNARLLRSVMGSAGFQPAAAISSNQRGFRANKADVERIAGNAIAGVRDARHGFQGRVAARMAPPGQRQHNVGQQQITEYERPRGHAEPDGKNAA